MRSGCRTWARLHPCSVGCLTAALLWRQAVAESMMSRDGKSTQLRLLVPAALCGAVIGKGGATIRSFAEDSKAAITVSSQDKQPPGVLDRVVRVTGGPEQLLRAVALLLTKLAENPNYARFTSATVSYAAPAVGPAPSAPFAASLPAVPTSGSGPKGQQRVEVTVSVPEGRVGAVIGKGGEVRVSARPPWQASCCLCARQQRGAHLLSAGRLRAQVISQLKSVVGVKIRISDREDFVPGTRNRKVTISGTADAVQIAQVSCPLLPSYCTAVHALPTAGQSRGKPPRLTAPCLRRY